MNDVRRWFEEGLKWDQTDRWLNVYELIYFSALFSGLTGILESYGCLRVKPSILGTNPARIQLSISRKRVMGIIPLWNETTQQRPVPAEVPNSPNRLRRSDLHRQ